MKMRITSDVEVMKMRITSDVVVKAKIEDLLSKGIIKDEAASIQVTHIRNKTSHNRKVLPRGGATVVTILFEDVGLISDKTECCIKDVYCKEYGRTTALKRILDARDRKLVKQLVTK